MHPIEQSLNLLKRAGKLLNRSLDKLDIADELTMDIEDFLADVEASKLVNLDE